MRPCLVKIVATVYTGLSVSMVITFSFSRRSKIWERWVLCLQCGRTVLGAGRWALGTGCWARTSTHLLSLTRTLNHAPSSTLQRKFVTPFYSHHFFTADGRGVGPGYGECANFTKQKTKIKKV